MKGDLMSNPSFGLPARASLAQLRKQAKELLRAARAGEAGATARFSAIVASRNAPPRYILADAQFAIAREYGFRSWTALLRHLEEQSAGDDSARPLIRPVELSGAKPYTLSDGSLVTTEDVWRMFVATRLGDRREVDALIVRAPALALVEYNYTPPIHFAVREGHRDLVELFLSRGADIAYRSYPFGDSLLTIAQDRDHHEIASLLRERLAQRFAIATETGEIIEAARAGDSARVRGELTRNPRLARASNETGDTALHHAAQRADHAMVHLLLDAGADGDAIRGDGYRPIHCALTPQWLGAVSSKGGDVADLLLARGARYTVYIAVLRGDREFVRAALRDDRSLADAEDTCHHRPLSAAARRNDVTTTKLLLDHDADPNLPEEGAPRGLALWIAVTNRYREIARLLIERGADPNAEIDSGGTPMGQARGDVELAAMLRSHGGIEFKGERDREREEVARLVGQRRLADAEKLLRERPGLLEDPESSWGDGILAGPARDGDHEVIAMLMRLGARVPPVSKWAPFYYFKHEATAAFLLANGMDPNHMNWHRLTLLHHMAAEGEIRKARLLIDHGADIDATDEEYCSTPLGVAARRGQRSMVALLLERGADPNLAAAPWATPLAWARKKGHAEIASTLRAAGAAE
jgi:ankyrin repeat protein